MTRPVCIITGATSGIGLETARAVAEAGHEVVLACRNPDRAEAARASIARQAGNRDIHVVICDLASLESVRRCAGEILERFPRIHVLINNAGTMLRHHRTSPEGLELTFATNYLGPWLLTRLLLGRLLQSIPARIVNVASAAHRSGSLEVADLQSAAPASFSTMGTYARSKLGNVMATLSLAEHLHGTGVTANCLHPGVVATNITGEAGTLLRLGMKLAAPFMRDRVQGAATTVRLALDPSLAEVSGTYFDARCRPSPPAATAADPQARQALWRWSSRFCGLPETCIPGP